MRRDRVRRAAAALLGRGRGSDPTLIPAIRELIFIDAILLRRPELNEHFQALERLAPLSFDELYTLVPDPQHSLGAARVRRSPEAVRRGRCRTTGALRVALAETLRQIGRRDEAIEVLTVVPESAPDALAVRACIALDRGDDRAAEAILAEGPADHPELARLRGRFALVHHDAPAAVRYFPRRAYSALPDDRDTVFGLGSALAMVGDHAAAAPYLRDSKAYDTLGGALDLRGEPGQPQ